MVIFHSYVSLPEGTGFASDSWAFLCGQTGSQLDPVASGVSGFCPGGSCDWVGLKMLRKLSSQTDNVRNVAAHRFKFDQICTSCSAYSYRLL